VNTIVLASVASLTYIQCGRPHTAHPVAKISKVKDLPLILLISIFSI